MKYIPWVALAVVGILFIRNCDRPADKEYIRVPVEIPSVGHDFAPIVLPAPKTPLPRPEIDSTYYWKYLSLKDSVARDSAYRDAITIREYETEFEDSIQTISVKSKTRGTLLEQSVSYLTKPRTIEKTVEIPKKGGLSVGVDLGFPLNSNNPAPPVVKGSLIFRNKKKNTLSLGIDTEMRVWIGKTYKIF